MMIHPHQSCHQLGSYYVGDQLGHTYIILKSRVTFRTIPYQKRDAAIVNNITVGLPKERLHYTQQTSSNCGGITMALHFVSFRRFIFFEFQRTVISFQLDFSAEKNNYSCLPQNNRYGFMLYDKIPLLSCRQRL